MNRPSPGLVKAVHKQVIRERFAEGWSDEDIAAELGVKTRTAQGKRLQMGLVRPLVTPYGTKVDEEWLVRAFEERIAGLYHGGDMEGFHRAIRQVAADAGVVHETIRRRLVKLGLVDPDFSRVAKSEDQWKLARYLLEEGLPYLEVERQVGISDTQLRKRVPGKGIRPEDKRDFMAAKHLERKLGLSR